MANMNVHLGDAETPTEGLRDTETGAAIEVHRQLGPGLLRQWLGLGIAADQHRPTSDLAGDGQRSAARRFPFRSRHHRRCGRPLPRAARSSRSERRKDALRDPWLKKNRKRIQEIDCGGGVVLPGFVDSHTHPVFMQPRLVDFEKRIAGATYEEIAEAGGGIRSSLDGVRKASRSGSDRQSTRLFFAIWRNTAQPLLRRSQDTDSASNRNSSLCKRSARPRNNGPERSFRRFWARMLYLRSIADAHESYVEIVCKEMMPAVAKQKLAQFVDVFCDRGAFSAEETEQIFAAAAAHGLRVRAHMGQLSETRIEPFLKFRPASLDHMDHVNDADLPALAASDTVATLVPGANYFLGSKKYPTARKLIDSGVAVALATDYNPGTSPTISMTYGDVAGVHAYENVAGGSDRRGDDQRCICAGPRRSQGQPGTGQGR